MRVLKAVTFLCCACAVSLLHVVSALCAYSGDTVIYSAAAVATEDSRPNVLFIIDNSNATLDTARGTAYDPDYPYPGEYNATDIYPSGQGGDFKNRIATLETLSCDDNDNIIEKTLQDYGTYAGAGNALYPSIANGGSCSYGTNNKGEVYALGNYLNYISSVPPPISSPEDLDESSDSECPSPPQVKACQTGSYSKCGYFTLTETHVSSTNPAQNNSADYSKWSYTNAPDGQEPEIMWKQGELYEMPICETDDLEEDAPETAKSQREIIFEALQTVLGGSRTYVNFAAMVYENEGNKGGRLVHPMKDLNAQQDFETFLGTLPGGNPGIDVIQSQTSRNQAEALYDAGYYFGANYPAISVNEQIGDEGSACGFNHVILITNGLSNKDSGGQQDLWSIIGDADGDSYPNNEQDYGLGSHWLDDVAAYLKKENGVTTHTVLAFQNYDPLVHNAAQDGGGSFYNVYNAEQLASALTKLLANIVKETDTAFVAPVVPTNPENRTFSGQRVYLGFFYPKSNQTWYGNLKKFGINSQNQIIDSSGEVAICPDKRSDSDSHCADNDLPDGNFRMDAVSYWNNAADGGIVEAGGAGAKLKARSTARKIFTYNEDALTDVLTDSDHAFTTANTDITAAMLGEASDAEKNKVIDFVHGLDAYAPTIDIDGDGVTENQEKREWIMGDILHSKPLVVNYSNFTYANESTCAGTGANKSMIFVGANDGMLHAFRDCSGEEAWAFIPPEFLPSLTNLTGGDHNFFVDASPVVYRYDKDGDGEIESGDGDWVMLLFGLRRGGSAYYALDVTDPENPEYLWTIDSSTSGFEELGQSWSEPQFGLVKDGSARKVVAFIGAGYDNLNEDQRFGNTQTFTGDPGADPASAVGDTTSSGTSTGAARGRGVYAFLVASFDANGNQVMATSPTKVWGFTRTGTISSHTHASFNQGYLDFSFPGDVAPVDTDFDGFIDRLYIGDTGGRMWRISDHHTSGELLPKPNADISTWFGRIIFRANPGADNSNGRKIFYRPSVVIDNGYVGVYFGTGDRAHPLNTAVDERLYAIFDRGQMTNDSIDEDDLENVSADHLQAADGTDSVGACTDGSTNLNCILERLRSVDNYGWYIKLDGNYGSLEGEKVLSPALVFNKVAYYTTYTPNPSTGEIETSDDCAGNLGTSRMWAVDFHTGEAVFNFNTVNDDTTVSNERATNQAGDIVMNYQDRFKSLGVGIPSGLVMVINAEGDAQVLIGCGGGVCPGASLPGGTVFPVYWMPW